MFTWICPQCGRECLPSQTECPDCTAKTKTKLETSPADAAPEALAGEAQPSSSMTGKDALRAPFQDKAAADPVAARRGMPTWLMSVVFTAGFGVLLVGLYFGIQYYKGKNEATTQAAPPKLETPSAEAPKPGALPKSNPLEKHLEVTGLRLLQDQAKKTEVRFVLVNHSGAEIADLAGEVNLMARTAKNDVASVGAFPFKTSLGPYESKELNATLNTQLKVYEIPDWQNLRSEIKITSPQ